MYIYIYTYDRPIDKIASYKPVIGNSIYQPKGVTPTQVQTKSLI